MKQCTPFCAGWWPFFALPGLLLLPVIFFNVDRIEHEIAANAQSLLDAEQPWAKARTFNSGREVLVTGLAPSQQAADQAQQVSASAKGVKSAQFVGRTATLFKPSRVKLTFRGDEVQLGGLVDSQSTVDLLQASASGGYAGRNVVNQLQIDTGVAPPNDLSWLFTATSELGDGNTLTIQNNKLTIEGKVKTGQIKRLINDRLNSQFSGKIDNRLTIAIDQNALCIARLNQMLVKSKINFQSESAVIDPVSDELLAELAGVAKQCQNAKFGVSGHTDNIGGQQLNLKLSQARAQAVVDRFIELGLEQEQLTATGYGASQPLTDNDSSSGRAANRRIEFTLKDSL